MKGNQAGERTPDEKNTEATDQPGPGELKFARDGILIGEGDQE